MNIKFILNQYILSWYLLFNESISSDLNNYKQKIWINYKKEYNALYMERNLLLSDPDNYISSDDTVYNIFNEGDIYVDIYKNVDKFRLALTKIFDENKKELVKCIKKVLRINISNYSVYLIDPRLSICDFSNSKNNILVYGKIVDKSFLEALMDIIYNIVKREVYNYQNEYKEIVEAVIEIFVYECSSRITGISHIMNGDKSLSFLKKKIYPYFLMYLGISKEDMLNYMMRDNICFDVDNYNYDKKLSKMDLFSFIDYCVNNQKNILKIEEIEI